MNEVVEAAVAGASLAAGAAIWLLAGYLIQRFAFRNPEPTYAIVFAKSRRPPSGLAPSIKALIVAASPGERERTDRRRAWRRNRAQAPNTCKGVCIREETG